MEEKTNSPLRKFIIKLSPIFHPIKHSTELEKHRPPPLSHLPTTYRRNTLKTFDFSPQAIEQSNKTGSPMHSYVDALEYPRDYKPIFRMNTPKTPIYFVPNSPTTPPAKRRAWWLQEPASKSFTPSPITTPSPVETLWSDKVNKEIKGLTP